MMLVNTGNDVNVHKQCEERTQETRCVSAGAEPNIVMLETSILMSAIECEV